NSKSLKGNGVWVEVSKLSPMTVDSRNLIVPGVSVGMLKLGMSYEKIIKIFGDPVDKYYYPDASIHDIRYKSKKTGNRIIFCFDTYGKCIEAIFTSGAFKTAEGIGRDEFSINMHRDLYNGFSRKCCLINYVNVRYYAKDGISFQYYNIKPGSGYKDSWIQGYVSVYLPEYKEPPLFPIGVGHWRENCGAFASGESRR
ncbi:hypothetical protein KAH81_10480, partial [bacterium]|nr:hypothetical protein [bacterium]